MTPGPDRRVGSISSNSGTLHMGAGVPVSLLLRERGEALRLLPVGETLRPDSAITDPEVVAPGLALAGFMAKLPTGRMFIFGETEMRYLASLPEEEAAERLEGFFSCEIPAVVVSKGAAVPDFFLRAAASHQVSVLSSSLPTKRIYAGLKPYLEGALAPSTVLHGSLADVYGVGLLFVGESGIGKSECVLDLLERGHRMVADDLVVATRRGHDVLMGTGHSRQNYHMEIRGVGIIDIRALFGIRSIRQQKRIEVVVQLERWLPGKAYDRTGLEHDTKEILGVPIPRVTIPLNPGKNITVISEVVAMNQLLKYSGVNSAMEFDRNLRDRLLRPPPIPQVMEEDYE